MNVIADCLKTYLRELPEPLIPYDLYDDFIGAGSTFLRAVFVSTF